MGNPAPVPVSHPLPAGLAGRTVVVVGGSSGIGLATGVLLRTVGARVVAVGRDPDRLAAAAAIIRGTGSGSRADAVLTRTADGSDEDQLRDALDRLGTIDHVLVTAATMAMGPLGGVRRADGAVAVESRLWAAYAAARVAADRLPAGGSLTLTSGDLAVRPQPGAALVAAGAGAIESLTCGLAVELAPRRVRVNAIRPGGTDTPLIRRFLGTGADIHSESTDAAIARAGAALPLGRLSTATEVAAAGLFLMANPIVTGTVVTVDGGQALG